MPVDTSASLVQTVLQLQYNAEDWRMMSLQMETVGNFDMMMGMHCCLFLLLVIAANKFVIELH